MSHSCEPTMCSNVLLLAVVFLIGLTTVGSSSNGCPEIALWSGYFAKVHDRTCYLFVNKERYWLDARNSCQNMGGEMLTVEDHSTMAFIRSMLNSAELGWNKRGVWAGARYSTGRWRWTSGKPVGYANWAPGEPSKFLSIFSVEDCALMRRTDNWRWHDYFCGGMKYHFNYICQFPVENATTMSTTTPTTTTTTTTSITTTTTMASGAVAEADPLSKKGHFLDGTSEELDVQGSHQQDNKMGEEVGELENRQNGESSHPYNVQGREPGYPYERRPGLDNRGYNEVHSTTQVHESGNMTILTIILVSGGIVLLILFMVFLIIRKRYNYKKALAQPAVHFENRNYNHAHGGSGHNFSHPLPPAPHSFHRPSAPPVPPRPLSSLTRPTPQVPSSYVPHSRPSSDLYLTPIEIGGGMYEEVRLPKRAAGHTSKSVTSIPAGGVDGPRAFGVMNPLSDEDCAYIPLISESCDPWNSSSESLHDMSGSLTMKTSSIHNDYVDMNGSPVVPPRSTREAEGPTKTDDHEPSDPKGKERDPMGYVSNDFSSDTVPFQGESKHSDYSNLMTTSQERCENLYAQLH